MQEMALAAHNLQLVYPGGSNPALADISFFLPRGEACGLIGPNGAGKTTLLSVFTTLLRPDTGSIEVLGKDILRHPRSILGKIGFVPQELALYERLTGLENLLFFARMYGLARNTFAQRLEYLKELFAMKSKLDRPVSTYSGGMKRRLNLMVGLMHDPELLFLDEPTVGIDTQSRYQILHRLQQLNEDGMTMIYTSHYLEEVQQLCKRVVIIDGGRIVAEGSPEGLVQRNDNCGSLTDLFLQTTGETVRD